MIISTFTVGDRLMVIFNEETSFMRSGLLEEVGISHTSMDWLLVHLHHDQNLFPNSHKSFPLILKEKPSYHSNKFHAKILKRSCPSK